MKKFLGHGLILFVFFLLTFFVERLIFIATLNEYIIESSEIILSMWIGLRLSCQTAGILTLIMLIARSKIIAVIIFIVTSILFIASIPFYEQFHSHFNQMIFNGFNDDWYALLITFIDEFNLTLRLIVALIMSWIMYQIYKRLPMIEFNLLIEIALTILISVMSFFGGSLSWKTELNFENIGLTKYKFLNEAILDSYQALYRAYVLQSRIDSSNGLNFTADNVKALAKIQSPNVNSNDLTDYLTKSAQGAKINKPKHIYLIISESYPNWVLLDKYSDLHIADGMKSIINSNESAYCSTFLPNGGSTVSAVTGIVSGLADANIYLTTIERSFIEPYPTAIAPQMKNLNYTTNFFYAGSSTWERIEDFVKAQGFDNFYSEGDIEGEGNVWGVDDEYLYRFVESKFDNNPSFNVILNTSNHSPYTVDVKIEHNFDEDTNRKLAHQKYADSELKKFIDDMKSPESLFIIVGDHADRFNLDKQPNDYERYCIPLIITGNETNKDILIEDCAGSQIDIMPTLIELIAPKDFKYVSIGESLTTNQQGVNYQWLITRHSLIDANASPNDYINFVRGTSYWLAKFGKELKNVQEDN